jgi:hypothetical protein
MANHRTMSERTRRTRTLVGGVMAGCALALAAPAGLALADPGPEANAGPHPVASIADTVGRPDFNKPAPGVRVAQAVGDTVFNSDTQLGGLIDGSPAGTVYHDAFGQRGTIHVAPDGTVIYDGDGKNGFIQGALNAPIGKVVGNAVPIRECNIKVVNQTQFPGGLRTCDNA